MATWRIDTTDRFYGNGLNNLGSSSTTTTTDNSGSFSARGENDYKEILDQINKEVDTQEDEEAKSKKKDQLLYNAATALAQQDNGDKNVDDIDMQKSIDKHLLMLQGKDEGEASQYAEDSHWGNNVIGSLPGFGLISSLAGVARSATDGDWENAGKEAVNAVESPFGLGIFDTIKQAGDAGNKQNEYTNEGVRTGGDIRNNLGFENGWLTNVGDALNSYNKKIGGGFDAAVDAIGNAAGAITRNDDIKNNIRNFTNADTFAVVPSIVEDIGLTALAPLSGGASIGALLAKNLGEQGRTLEKSFTGRDTVSGAKLNGDEMAAATAAGALPAALSVLPVGVGKLASKLAPKVTEEMGEGVISKLVQKMGDAKTANVDKSIEQMEGNIANNEKVIEGAKGRIAAAEKNLDQVPANTENEIIEEISSNGKAPSSYQVDYAREEAQKLIPEREAEAAKKLEATKESQQKVMDEAQRGIDRRTEGIKDANAQKEAIAKNTAQQVDELGRPVDQATLYGEQAIEPLDLVSGVTSSIPRFSASKRGGALLDAVRGLGGKGDRYARAVGKETTAKEAAKETAEDVAEKQASNFDELFSGRTATNVHAGGEQQTEKVAGILNGLKEAKSDKELVNILTDNNNRKVLQDLARIEPDFAKDMNNAIELINKGKTKEAGKQIDSLLKLTNGEGRASRSIMNDLYKQSDKAYKGMSTVKGLGRLTTPAKEIAKTITPLGVEIALNGSNNDDTLKNLLGLQDQSAIGGLWAPFILAGMGKKSGSKILSKLATKGGQNLSMKGLGRYGLGSTSSGSAYNLMRTGALMDAASNKSGSTLNKNNDQDMSTNSILSYLQSQGNQYDENLQQLKQAQEDRANAMYSPEDYRKARGKK